MTHWLPPFEPPLADSGQANCGHDKDVLKNKKKTKEFPLYLWKKQFFMYNA